MEVVKRSSGTLAGAQKIVDPTVEQAAPGLDTATDADAVEDIPFSSRFSGKQEESKLFGDNVTDTAGLRIAAGELCSSLSTLDPDGMSCIEAPNSD